LSDTGFNNFKNNYYVDDTHPFLDKILMVVPQGVLIIEWDKVKIKEK
jgi:hypothetical protein